MLTYESVVTLLLSGAVWSSLNVQFSQEQLDPHTLLRTFSLTCLPDGQTATRGDMPFATLSFTWDAAFTALSVMGSDAICDLYHAPDESCTHHGLGCAYDAMLDLDVNYLIPLSETQRFDISSVPALARQLQELSASITTNHTPLDIEVQMQFTSGFQAFLSRISARQQWTLDEQLHNEEDLLAALRDVCRDIALLLKAFNNFVGPVDPNTAPPEDDELPSVRQSYLRPPTA